MQGVRFTVLPNGSLQISKASVLDSGTYMCVAQNPAGTALGKIKLKVQGRSNTKVILTSPSISYLTIHFLLTAA